MRQYRGLTTKDGKWVKGWYVYRGCVPNDTHYIYSSGFHHEVIPETVGQSTGLKDKNGTDLDWWEDDLLRKGSDHPCAPIGRIIYDTRKARWVIVGKSGGEFCGLLEAYKNGWKKFGNVHQEQDNG